MEPEPFLRVTRLGKSFARRTWWAGQRESNAALHDISFSLARGRTLGVVGPSGSGKSTLARCLALFDAPTSGEIFFEGKNLWKRDAKQRRTVRSQIHLIFQEPAASLNPRFTAAEIVEEPLVIQKRGSVRERRVRAGELLEMVGLARDATAKRPCEFSGGERHRLAIARALALEPGLLILDESFSGLDLAIQVQLESLLLDLQKRLSLTYILISHDLSAVASLADEIAVLDRGELVEHSSAANLLAHPIHPRTKELVEASLALRWDGAQA
ncbi:MAG TPA: dipeptide/oligopeptide/nickel ABC transporter ATP-binding protein [Bryobacteraceae bacterium]|nr:dipeptide/oligopeptide/nickel ABC transporter ATP-binding protein [Bryobacteraceae bacterium]